MNLHTVAKAPHRPVWKYLICWRHVIQYGHQSGVTKSIKGAEITKQHNYYHATL